jgi:fibronectin-binding autotransporter adhesin
MLSDLIHSLSRLTLLSMLFCGASNAADIPILNSSFESPTVASGAFDIRPDNWSRYNTVLDEDYVYKPIIAPNLNYDFSSAPPQGLQVLGIANIDTLDKGVIQQLAANFQADSQYTLSVKVGSSDYLNSVAGFPGYVVQLVAGDTVIKSASGDMLSVGLGRFITVSMTYEFDVAHAPLAGQPLKIRLLSGGENVGEVAFDDVKLTALLANPVADAGGPYYLANPTNSLSLNASASIPSGNATITTYEWDLDNDGQYDDATGATPAAISYLDLINLYGFVDGSNPVFLRITDSDSKIATAQVTVELVASTKYTGVNASNADTWNTATNWDNGVPVGNLDVLIPSGKLSMVWSDATPLYTGNLTLQNNASLTVGFSTILPGSYNGLGVPGISRIAMNPGSIILLRSAGTPVIPEVQLLGNASFNLGTSTGLGAQAQFNYPITGTYQLQLLGNSTTNCVATLSSSNGISSLLATGTEGGLTIVGNAAGSLGTGNITITRPTNPFTTSNYAILRINVANSMADTATVRIDGNSTTRLTMNANDTIAALIVNGVTQPLGTYTRVGGGGTYQFSWITGNGILTVATPQVKYWDINGTTAEAGSSIPAGIWNSSNTFWNANEAGTGSIAAWTAGQTAIFSAGSDATGSYAVEVVGTQDISGINVRNGSLTFNEGIGGTLRLTSSGTLSIVSGSSVISTPITEDASSRSLSKSGLGTLTVTGNLSHTGGTSLQSGNIVLSGNNILATGATSISSGVLRVDAPSAIPGTTRNTTINSSGAIFFGPSFGSGNIQTALNNRIVTTSAGTIAADNYAATNFDFNAASLTAAYFGSLSIVNYTGTLTPNGSNYRLSGDGGVLTMANANALTGNRNLITRGLVALAANNDYTGTTTVSDYGSLSILGSSSTSGITLNIGTTLTVGHNSSLGTGTLTLAGQSTLIAIGTITTTNPVTANADFTISGSGILSLGSTTINNNRAITNNSNTTFSSISRDGSNNRNLTINGSGNTTVTGNLTLGTGTLTKNNNATLTLLGAATFTTTTINGGILRLNGSISGAGATTINAATLELGGSLNGGMATGDITINNSSAVIQAASADRTINNNIILNSNLTISGSYGLTVGGTLTNFAGNRIITNNVTASGKTLTLGALILSNDIADRTLIISGSGNTIVNGIITNGSGVGTNGNLTKSGAGTLTLNGANTYSGVTTVSAGKMFVNGSTGAGNVAVSANATLGGTGTIGGDVEISTNGKLEFNIGTNIANHNKLELAATKSLTFSPGSSVTITSTPNFSPTNGTYTLLTAPDGITGPLPTLNDPDGWNASLSIVGNDLLLNIIFTGIFPINPTLLSIQDTQNGGIVFTNTTFNYTVTFSEDMDAATVTSSDFGNAGTAAININSVTETTPGVFNVQITPTSAGTLQFRINAGATLTSTAALNLNTSSALLDDNMITVQTPLAGLLTVSFGDFISSGTRGGSFSPLTKQYTLTNNGVSSLDWTAGKTASWLDLSSSGGTLAAGASTTVTATINGSASSQAIGTYYDTITFTNTTNNVGDTTRGVGLNVNGLPAQVTLSNLNQIYNNGTPISVGVTTNPPSLAHSITYDGLTNEPTTAGSYDIVATVTDPDYSGTATGTLVIAKAAQTINFAALDPIGNNITTLALTATASSGLPVSYTSSDSSIATVSGNTLTIVGIGTTTITASQPGDNNYEAAADIQRTLEVILVDPLAVPGGPYTVLPASNLVLNGSGSIPSGNSTITTYEWDLNDGNDGGGAFTVNATGVSPSISSVVLQSTHGMVDGINTIRLRVSDSSGKTSAPVTAVVNLIAPLTWDGNAATALQTDGPGGWFDASRWWTGTTNTSWLPGSDIAFGNGGTGNNASLNAATNVGRIFFNTFGGTYTLGSTGNMLTVYGDITKSATSGAVNFISPLTLGEDQTWSNPTNTLTASSTLNLSNRILTIDNTGLVNFRNSISGSGGIIKTGPQQMQLITGPHTFTGGLTINQGSVMIPQDYNMGSSNVTLNNGTIVPYWSGTLTRALGSGPNQIQILGGISGFDNAGSNSGGGATVQLTGDPTYEVVWGSQFFNPTEFELGGNPTGSMNFNNRIDLNGASRILRASNATAAPSLAQRIRNSSATPAGLIKTGPGQINLNNANTYDGGTTLQAGTIQLGNVNGLGSQVGTLTVNGGLLNIRDQTNVTVGNLTGTGGAIANHGTGARTFIIGNGGGNGGNFQGVIADRTSGTTTGTLALTKTGSGTITLSGINTYTGNTAINQGKLFINGTNGTSNITVANGATFGGTGAIGGNVTVAAGGNLEFNISTVPGSHDPLNIATGKALAFSGTSELKLNLSYGVTTGTYVLVTGGNNITGVAPATLSLPLGCTASVSIVGNELRLVITAIGDVTPPSLDSITDNLVGDNTILIDTVVTYTVSFNEDIDASTVSAADFTNAGTSAINIGTISETSPGVFNVPVRPTTAGNLQLRIPTNAVIQDISGNSLVSTPAIDDGTTVTVTTIPFTAWSNAGSFNTDSNNDGIPNGLAWLLGASDPNVNAQTYLPVADQDAGKLELSFSTLITSARGTASIKVQYSKDLGIADDWDDHEIDVPGAVGTYNNYLSSGIDFVISNQSGDYIDVVATIPASAAAPGTKLFARVKGTAP